MTKFIHKYIFYFASVFKNGERVKSDFMFFPTVKSGKAIAILRGGFYDYKKLY